MLAILWVFDILAWIYLICIFPIFILTKKFESSFLYWACLYSSFGSYQSLSDVLSVGAGEGKLRLLNRFTGCGHY